MRLELSDASIAYDDAGEGEPVVFLHGSLSADWLTPVAGSLRGFRRIVIHRADYGASEDRVSGVGLPAQAGTVPPSWRSAACPGRTSSGTRPGLT